MIGLCLGQALANGQCRGERLARLLALAQRAMELAHLVERHRQVASVVGIVGFGIDHTLLAHQQCRVTIDGATGLAQCHERPRLLIGHHCETFVGLWQRLQHFGRERGNGHALLEPLHGIDASCRRIDRFVEIVSGQKVASRLHAVPQLMRLVGYAPPSIASGTPEALSVSGRIEFGQALRGPTMNHRRPVRQAMQQRQIFQRDQRPLRRLQVARLRHIVRQHPRKPCGRHRQVRDRELQHRFIDSGRLRQLEQFVQENVPSDEQLRRAQALVEVSGGARWIDRCLVEEQPEFPGNVRRQLSLAAAQQGVEEFEHSRVPVDHPQHRLHLSWLQAAQRGHPQHHLAHLGGAERAQRDASQPAVGAGDRIAASEEQASLAAQGLLRQRHQCHLGARVEELLAAVLEVLLEVVQQEQHALFRDGLVDQALLLRLADGLRNEPIAEQDRGLRLGIPQRRADAGEHLVQSIATGVHGDNPAILDQPLHRATDQRTLADAADAGHDGADMIGIGVANRLEHLAQFAAAPDQVIHPELGHRSAEVIDRRHVQRLPLRAEIGDRDLLAGDEERCGGIFGRRMQTAAERALASRLDVLSRRRQRTAGPQVFTFEQAGVEGPSQIGGIAVADGRLHGEHRRRTLVQQRLGKAGAWPFIVDVRHAAVTGVEQHHRQGTARALQRRKKIRRCHGHGAAILVFQLEFARTAMARQVKHMVGIAGERRGDLVGVADFQDSHLRVILLIQRFHRVEDVLEFAFLVENRRRERSDVGRAHCHQDLQRTCEDSRRAFRHVERTAPHDDGYQRREQAAVGQPQGLERQAEQALVARGEADLDETAPALIDRLLQRLRRAIRQAHRGDGPAEFGHLRFAGTQVRAGAVAPDVAAEAAPERREGRGHVVRSAGRAGHRAMRKADRAARRAIGSPAQLDHDARGRAKLGRMDARGPRTPVAQAIRDGVDLVDAAAQQWREQGGNLHVLVQHHRDQDFPLLDAREDECADFGSNPGTRHRVGRQHDDAGVGGLESQVDPGGDVMPCGHIPSVQQRFEAARRQRLGKHQYRRFVQRRVTDENAQRFLRSDMASSARSPFSSRLAVSDVAIAKECSPSP